MNDTRNAMRHDMAYAARELLGRGFTTDYYLNASSDFATIAELYAREVVKSALALERRQRQVEQQQRRLKEVRTATRPRPVYRFAGRAGDTLVWVRRTAGQAVVSIPAGDFWGRLYPNPTSDDVGSSTNPASPTQPVEIGGFVAETATSGCSGGVR
jgi:hypothetical protein